MKNDEKLMKNYKYAKYDLKGERYVPLTTSIDI